MLCVDTSSLIAYLQGSKGKDVELIDQALADQGVVLACVTITELLSDPDLPIETRAIILGLPMLPLTDSYWERAGLLRASVLRRGAKARLADTLIAQQCLDHHATLVTRGRDFKIFRQIAGLKALIVLDH
jgi:predicted nucleic acid-binding protein